MIENVINAGDEVDSYCTTCKLMLAHRIVAIVEGRVDTVICQTCHKRHKYRPHPPKASRVKSDLPEGATETREPRPAKEKKPKKTRKAKDLTGKWEELLAKKNVAQAKVYAMQGVFEQDDVISHAKFGYGLVTAIRAEGKMEVLFREGTKLLVCGRETAVGLSQ
jgi:hypothetical protein